MNVEPAGKLSPERRRWDLASLAQEQLDVLVVGGGVTGAGAALDAASRGLSVGLIEAQDWAAGTSSRSSKLVHGGLRYLQMLDFGLVREGLHERGLLLSTLAPHLVQPLPILYPLHRHAVERAYAGAGVMLYDLLGMSMGGGRSLPLHRNLSKRRALQAAPALSPDALCGALLYWDAQVDDARYVTELVRTAAFYGARVVNRATVTALRQRGGRVLGAQVRDEQTGADLETRARVIISATGVWSEETEALAGYGRTSRVRPSKGAHILVERAKIASSTGIILRTARSVLFVLPWRTNWLIGTTDTDWPYDKSRPLASAADVRYLLSELNKVLRHPLSPDDVLATYAGLRPLVAGGGVVRGPGEAKTPTTKLSREHAVTIPTPGLVVVSGGKYTTYRVMAADAVDAAVADGALHALPCRTSSIPLIGARCFDEAWNSRQDAAAAAGLSVKEVERLLGRYGSLAGEVIALCADRPELAKPLPGGSGYNGAEVVYAVTHEGALHVDDVLRRRTRAAIEAPGPGVHAAGEVARLMAPLLGWDQATAAEEAALYRREVELERIAARAAPDDAAASAMGTGAWDLGRVRPWTTPRFCDG